MEYVGTLTPPQCTIHLGFPVVPEEYAMKKGYRNETCSKISSSDEALLRKVGRVWL
jgi:hypothetical protein